MQKSSVNKVILVGHLGNKPEGRYTPSGVSTVSFSIATNETWVDNNQDKNEHTEWHNIIAWNKLADFATEYLYKGQLVCIEGKLRTRSYSDKDGIKKWITEIVCTSLTPLDWKSKKNSEAGDTSTNMLSNDDTMP